MEFKPLVLIPSYNTGRRLLRKTVEEVLNASSATVFLVIDGSTDGSGEEARQMAAGTERLRLLAKDRNEGKGAAVRSGLQLAEAEGFTHALVMDADGQHPADRINDFLEQAEQSKEAMILGQPVFDENVPLERLYGRKLSVWLVHFEVFGDAIGDPLYGFRVYPIQPLLHVMGAKGRSDRYDFDPEVAVRLNWMGVPAVKIDSKVEYLDEDSGGVSHFHYIRDNARFVWLHTRLILEAPLRWLLRPKSSKAWKEREENVVL